MSEQEHIGRGMRALEAAIMAPIMREDRESRKVWDLEIVRLLLSLIKGGPKSRETLQTRASELRRMVMHREEFSCYTCGFGRRDEANPRLSVHFFPPIMVNGLHVFCPRDIPKGWVRVSAESLADEWRRLQSEPNGAIVGSDS